ncbi:MAG: hypothetical protein HC877_14055 [Thioploca sp.]|nr:hypothetical protein [Thioploca sp.]
MQRPASISGINHILISHLFIRSPLGVGVLIWQTKSQVKPDLILNNNSFVQEGQVNRLKNQNPIILIGESLTQTFFYLSSSLVPRVPVVSTVPKSG